MSNPSGTGPSPGGLARRLSLTDAVVIGLGSMIGAGVFGVWAPAAQAAGTNLLLGLALAGLVAFCNASSSAQLAAQFPTSGGTYVYGRELLGEWPGFCAGWAFLVGKTASCAAMALTFAAYAAPPGWDKPLAAAAVAALAIVNSLGVTRTAALVRVLVATSVIGLAIVASIGLSHVDVSYLTGGAPGSTWAVLQSAGFLFFAFAGYARIATMGEEVIEPARTIPRAIVTALAVVLAIYSTVGLSALASLGSVRLATSEAPLVDVAALAGASWPVVATRFAAAGAALGALLAMIAGVGRTALAMARTGDLPRSLAAVHPRFAVPHRAQLAVGVAACALVLATDLRGAIGFSSFGVLIYYLVANLAALRQEPHRRRYPRVLAGAGAVGCLVIACTVGWQAVLAGTGVILVGALYRWIRLAHD